MEMNTRIQVEHPVTEEVARIDLIKGKLPWRPGIGFLKQSEIAFQGHAIECRINAERRPNFRLPGLISISTRPAVGVRVDSHLSGYRAVPLRFMVAKIICWGRDRDESIARMRRALLESVDGIDDHPVPSPHPGRRGFLKGRSHRLPGILAPGERAATPSFRRPSAGSTSTSRRTGRARRWRSATRGGRRATGCSTALEAARPRRSVGTVGRRCGWRRRWTRAAAPLQRARRRQGDRFDLGNCRASTRRPAWREDDSLRLHEREPRHVRAPGPEQRLLSYVNVSAVAEAVRLTAPTSQSSARGETTALAGDGLRGALVRRLAEGGAGAGRF